MLDVCSEFAERYDVIFNTDKSKLLTFGNARVPPNGVQFAGGTISYVTDDLHLGNPIGNKSDSVAINHSITELYSATNIIMSYFSPCDISVRYELFKTYGMSLYGSVLLNYTGRDINRLYVTWRECVRRLLGVPTTTHCALLPGICRDLDPATQLIRRCVKFIQQTMCSGNPLTRMCMRMAMAGSRSNISDTMSLITQTFKIPRYNLPSHPVQHILAPHTPNQDVATAIRDILLDNVPHLDKAESMQLLHYLCTG